VEGTPGSLEPSRKRKRIEQTSGSLLGQSSLVQESAASSDYSVKSSAKDVVEISEIDAGGKFVKIYNSSVDKVLICFGSIILFPPLFATCTIFCLSTSPVY